MSEGPPSLVEFHRVPPTRPADLYSPTADLWVVTAYFNPAGFRSKRVNYDLFREPD